MSLLEYLFLFVFLPIALPFLAAALSGTSGYFFDAVINEFLKRHSVVFYSIFALLSVFVLICAVSWSLNFPEEMASESRWVFRDFIPFLNVSFR